MKFVKPNQSVKKNTFYMNYISGGRAIYAYYVTDEEFDEYEHDKKHFRAKPLYNCVEMVAVEETYTVDPNEQDESLKGDYLYELTEEEGLLIGDLFS